MATASTHNITGMHCKACVSKVTDALKSIDGIRSINVSLHPPLAEVEMSDHVPTETLDRAVQTAGGYRLVETGAAPEAASTAAPKKSLYPLFLIVGYIAGTVAIVAFATGEQSPHVLMRYFMGGFFLVFSFFAA